MKEWCFNAHIHIVGETEAQAGDAISEIFRQLHSNTDEFPSDARRVERADGFWRIKLHGEVLKQ